MARKSTEVDGGGDRVRARNDTIIETDFGTETGKAGMAVTRLTVEGRTHVLTFNDEFDESTAAYWTGYGKDGVWATSFSPHLENSRTISTNGDLQYYVDPDMAGLPNPFTVSDGKMTINASVLNRDQRAAADGMAYGSGMLSTEMSFATDGGYIEISADIPDQKGLWSAFWMMPADGDWSSEIDVFEYLGASGDVLHTNLWAEGSPDAMVLEDSGAGDGFHTYGLYWDENVIRWSLDGVTIRESANSVQEDMYLIFNLAVGGWAGKPDATTEFTDGYSIDYIRVYELESHADRNSVADDRLCVMPAPHVGTMDDDVMSGSDWADIVNGLSGDDTLYGDAGNDTLSGSEGNDFIYGNVGDDVLAGGSGDDQLVGGEGSDVLNGGTGTDHLWGGSYGADETGDEFVFEIGTGTDYVHDFEAGLDRIDLTDFGSDWADIRKGVSDLGWAAHIDLASLGGNDNDQIYLVGCDAADLSATDFGHDPIA